MSSTFGNKLKISVFGQSHSEEIGVVIDGFPAGFAIDFKKLDEFMAMRAPGQNAFQTSRRESDRVTFVSGVVNGITCGAPICAIIANIDARPGDYPEKLDTPRPSHADLTNNIKYNGFEDVRGGGHSSGRLTAPLCVAGALCLQLLSKNGIEAHAHIASIHGISDTSVGLTELPLIRSSRTPSDFEKVSPADSEKYSFDDSFPVIDKTAGARMIDEILDAKSHGDSVGGTIEVAFTGLMQGIGSPMFDGLENRISAAVFAVPAVKGIEFGNGFEAASLFGSQNNDAFAYSESGAIITKTNRHGGILGGISSGMPLVFKVAVKPTPSIAQTQETVSLRNKCNTTLETGGRHDPCIVPRALPGVVSAAAVAITDACLCDGIFS